MPSYTQQRFHMEGRPLNEGGGDTLDPFRNGPVWTKSALGELKSAPEIP